MLTIEDYSALRRAIADISGDISSDAVGTNVARLDEIFAPDTHAAALDPHTPIVLGSRGAGKSFWSGVLGQYDTRTAAAEAYPRLGLSKVDVQFGYTGIGGPKGISSDAIDAELSEHCTLNEAKTFWWATILSAAARSNGDITSKPAGLMSIAENLHKREEALINHDLRLQANGKTLLVVYDALDTVARNWPRRRLLTDALLEVVWALRAYSFIRPKLFLRPDQMEDDSLRFVELPKLRTGAVKLRWTKTDLYGLLFSRLSLTSDLDAKNAFSELLQDVGLKPDDRSAILSRRWSLVSNATDQKKTMAVIAGPYMGQGRSAYKKGNTYDWPFTHLSDAFSEVTPRSFLGMMIAAAKHDSPPETQVLSAEGIRHGLREASKTRVDQLHLEFPWIKGVLAPLAGILLPLDEHEIFKAWKEARTLDLLFEDAEKHHYIPPFPSEEHRDEIQLFLALERIGVMFKRKDGRLDMPDLFRVAAKLLKKGALTPIS